MSGKKSLIQEVEMAGSQPERISRDEGPRQSKKLMGRIKEIYSKARTRETSNSTVCARRPQRLSPEGWSGNLQRPRDWKARRERRWPRKIGRASCRERVEVRVVDVAV